MSHSHSFRTRRDQRGSLYIAIVFVLVVMGFLASLLSRIQWSNADGYTKDVLGTQAWFLAQSVNESSLTVLYPLDSVTNIKKSCVAVMPTPSFISGTVFSEIPNCRLVENSCESLGTLADMNYFRLTARVNCGSGKSLVERAEEIWVRELNND